MNRNNSYQLRAMVHLSGKGGVIVMRTGVAYLNS